jgi:hypothetical protein
MDEYMDMNRALWDEWVDIHTGSEFYGLEQFRRGGTELRPYELEEVGPVADTGCDADRLVVTLDAVTGNLIAEGTPQ